MVVEKQLKNSQSSVSGTFSSLAERIDCGMAVTLAILRRMSSRLALAATVFASLAFVNQANGAEILYGVAGSGTGNPSSLYTLDPANGAGTLVGAVGFNSVAAMDFHPTTGVLYGISRASPATLITIDTVTGAGTAVLDISGSFAGGIPDMSFDSSGTLYVVDESGTQNPKLVTLDLVTGTTSFIGSLGGSFLFRGGVAIDSNDITYVKFNEVGDIYTMDTTTGGTTFVTSTSVGTDNVLAFNAADVLYSVVRDNSVPDSDLYTIDLVTGNTTLIGTTGVPRLSALAFRDEGGAEEVRLISSCLAGNGRVDLNIVNTQTVGSVYRLEFQGLSARQTNNVAFEDWARLPLTGRPDATYSAVVKRDGVTILSGSIPITCDAPIPTVSAPEVTIVNACRSNLGQVFFQFANPTASARGYTIAFDGVPNRSTTAEAYGQSRRGTTGRPDGTYNYSITSGGAIIDSGTVIVDCV